MCVYLQSVYCVVVVFKSVVSSSPRGDVKHLNSQLVQRPVRRLQISYQMPNALVATCKWWFKKKNKQKKPQWIRQHPNTLHFNSSIVHSLMLHRLTVEASNRQSPVCVSQWPLSQLHSAKCENKKKKYSTTWESNVSTAPYIPWPAGGTLVRSQI